MIAMICQITWCCCCSGSYRELENAVSDTYWSLLEHAKPSWLDSFTCFQQYLKAVVVVELCCTRLDAFKNMKFSHLTAIYTTCSTIIYHRFGWIVETNRGNAGGKIGEGDVNGKPVLGCMIKVKNICLLRLMADKYFTKKAMKKLNLSSILFKRLVFSSKSFA